MLTVGLIVEYNPFHNGHLYHLEKARELYKDCIIILVMSSTFMQRGEPSIIDKWEKTKIALEHGIDVVVELPFPFSTSSADLFAKGAIGLLDALKTDVLVFGSESGDIDELNSFVESTYDNEEIEIKIKEFINDGHSYPKAMSLAAIDFGNITMPNDILGISYLKEIKKLNSKIIPNTIKRTSSYHSNNLDSNIVSATSVRKALREKTDVKNYVPSATYKRLNNLVFMEDFYPYLKYKILSEIDYLNKYNLVDEGIENKIKKHINTSNNLDELIMNIKSKRYTYSKLRRMFTHIMCSYTKEENERNKELKYIRILGLSDVGSKYIKSIKKEVELPIITNFTKLNNEMLDIEARATSIYNLISNNNLIQKEYKNNAKNIE